MKNTGSRYFHGAILSASLIGGLSCSGVASGFQIDSGNPDVKMSWNNNVNLLLGFRTRDCDPNICGNGLGPGGSKTLNAITGGAAPITPGGQGDVAAYQSDRKFPNGGDIVSKRVDLFSEFKFVYKGDTGFNVGASAWYNAAYDNKIEGEPAMDGYYLGAYQGAGRSGGPYLHSTKRYIIGPSAEMAEVYGFTKFDVGNVPVSVKLGRHTVFWGEPVFSIYHSVSDQQNPLDLRKAVENPYIGPKEFLMPRNQFSFEAQLSKEVSLLGQYFFQWKPATSLEGGAYLGAADGMSTDGGGTILGTKFIGNTDTNDKTGEWGLGLKWRPVWLDGGTAGVYYRSYYDAWGSASFDSVSGSKLVDFSHPRAQKAAFSLSKRFGDINVISNFTYSMHGRLPAVVFGTPVGGVVGNSLLPLGNIWTALLNVTVPYGKTSWYDSALLKAELTYTGLDKIISNPKNIRLGKLGAGYGCQNKDGYGGCVTAEAFGMTVKFEPKWLEVRDGVDVTMPIYYSVGLKGTGAIAMGTSKGAGTYSIGAFANIDKKYTLGLEYRGFMMIHNVDELGAFSNNTYPLGKLWDRNWLALSFKTAF